MYFILLALQVASAADLYVTNFEALLNQEWSPTTRTSHPNFSSFAGRYGNNTLTFTRAIPAGDYCIEYDLYVLDSWDGLNPGNPSSGPDMLRVQVNNATVFDHSLTHACVGSVCTYTPEPGQILETGSNLGFWDAHLDAKWRDMHHRTNHPGGNLTIAWTGSNLQGIDDESWGIDNFRVYDPVNVWPDTDGDGFGDSARAQTACYVAPGFVDNGSDCDDDDAAVRPGATEVVANGVDENCDGLWACYLDNDDDNYGTSAGTWINSTDGNCTNDPRESNNRQDCNDNNAGIRPNATDAPGDTVDQNCDGLLNCYTDGDADGFGSGTTTIDAATCDTPSTSSNGDDCNDGNATINPDATDLPGDPVDQDCDGDYACYVDADNDNFGSSAVTDIPGSNCNTPTTSGNDNDCDDTTSSIRPNAVEAIGNLIDENCDGDILCHGDGDGDGYGGANGILSSNASCSDPGESLIGDDCNDLVATINPGATDLPGDTIDQDCDGDYACYLDSDGDTYGSSTIAESALSTCDSTGRSPNDDDCDDTDPALNPAAAEIPGNGIDENCDQDVVCFVDADGDGFGSDALIISADDSCDDPGESETGGDCDDSSASINPDATDTPGDAIDQDCDGDYACYVDADGDAYGIDATVDSPDASCTDDGESDTTDDCDDTNADVNPGATEIAGNGLDDDCSGDVLCFADTDGDGDGSTLAIFSADDTCDAPGESDNDDDCDDTNASVNLAGTDLPGDALDQDCDGDYACYVDGDGDGFGGTSTLDSLDASCTDPGESETGDDCDDTDALIYPGATEIPGNNVDEDCSGDFICFADLDGDGFGSDIVTSADAACDGPGESDVGGDCDDTDPLTNPDGIELAGDDIDQDCNGEWLCFTDGDGDGFGSTATIVSLDDRCDDPGESETGDDCDDSAATIFPGADDLPADTIDQDCDGDFTCFVDADGDGHGTTSTVDVDAADCLTPGASPLSDDCDDTDAQTYPGATDLPGDTIDQDCDGDFTCFVDADSDGFGDDAGLTIDSEASTCDTTGASPNDEDCDDTVATTNPTAVDIPGDTLDQDCDGAWDCYGDGDGDGFGTAGIVSSFDPSCDGAGESTTADDCDDTVASTFPGADDLPADGIDSNCDGLHPCYLDGDGDGFGGGTLFDSTSPDCSAAGTAPTPDDCDDTDAAIYPGAPDIPGDGIDQDCSGEFQCFLDADNDGFGDIGGQTITSADADCDAPGESSTSDDCNDLDATTNPAAVDVVGDALDQDCDGDYACFEDLDGDGYGGDGTVDGVDPSCRELGQSPDSEDCDDEDGGVNPGALEVAGNEIDEDCSGDIDCWLDFDEDGYGNAGGVTVVSDDDRCDGIGESLTADDCDDEDPLIHPGATEIPGNDLDEDCSGDWTCYADADDDGHGSDTLIVSADELCDDVGEAYDADDCDDTDASISPSAVESPGNDVDEDCDGIWDCYADVDLDGFADADGVIASSDDPDCDDPGEGVDLEDCNDDDDTVFPGAEEIPNNGIDEDCDGEDLTVEEPPSEANDLDKWLSGGCACDGSGTPAPWSLLLLLLLPLRRRRT